MVSLDKIRNSVRDIAAKYPIKKFLCLVPMLITLQQITAI
jgi:hypothetical protein